METLKKLSEMHSTTINQTSGVLILEIVSNDLSIKKPQDIFGILSKNIQNAFEDFKLQFIEFIENELIGASNERRELLQVVRSELNSILWIQRLIKMQSGGYQIFNEFVREFKPKKYFSNEVQIVKYYEKKNDQILILKITEIFKIIFENTNSAKYQNVDRWFEMFSRNLKEEFENYAYILWEKVALDLKDSKPLDFPPLNAILRMLETAESCMRVDEINFLKSIKLL